jgi:hypothetical protein
MSYKNRIITTIITVLLWTESGCFLPAPGKGKAIDVWETSHEGLAIRVTALAEKGTFLAGTYFVFESANNGRQYREVMTFRHDDRPAIPRENVRFISGREAYAFMGCLYAVTVDGGNAWHVWDAERDLPTSQSRFYRVIESVDIGAKGEGVMRLRLIDTTFSLYTTDYGVHWHTKN